MGKVVPFKKPDVKKPDIKQFGGKKQGLCQHGFHDWLIDKKQLFDVKQGKLVTRYLCRRCGKSKVKTD